MMQGSHEELIRLLARAIRETLTPREAAILEMRLGLSGHEPHILEEIGRAFHLSRERIRQLVNRSFRRLRTRARRDRASAAAELFFTVRSAAPFGDDRESRILGLVRELGLHEHDMYRLALLAVTPSGKGSYALKKANEIARDMLKNEKRPPLGRPTYHRGTQATAPKTFRAKTFSLNEVRKKYANAWAPWTPQEEERLAEMFRAGASIPELSRRLGRG